MNDAWSTALFVPAGLGIGAAITGLRESKAFKGSVVGGRMHLLVGTPSGEIGFYVADNAAWINAITSVRPQARSY